MNIFTSVQGAPFFYLSPRAPDCNLFFDNDNDDGTYIAVLSAS